MTQTPKTVEIPFGLCQQIALYLEQTPTARDVPAGVPVGMAHQLAQHADTAVKHMKQKQKLAMMPEDNGKNLEGQGLKGPRPTMDKLLSDAKRELREAIGSLRSGETRNPSA